MKKSFELVKLYSNGGAYVARVCNLECGYYKTIRFLWYSKKEVLNKLRNEYGVICRAGTY